MPSLWWKNLSREEQLLYLKSHPRSKLKPKPAKRGRKATKAATRSKKLETKTSTISELKQKVDDPAVTSPEPLRGEAKKQAVEYVEKNSKEITSALNSRMDEEKRRIPEVIASMPSKELSRVGRLLRDSAEKDRGRNFLNAAGIILGRAGLLTVGLALTTAVGIPPTIYLLGLWKYRDTIKDKFDTPLKDMVTGFTEGLYDSIKEGLRNPENIKKNLTSTPPTTSIAPKIREAASVAVPHHINDAIVAYNNLRKKTYTIEKARRVNIHLMRARYLTTMLAEVEKDLRCLNNLHIRFRITNDQFYIAQTLSSMQEVVEQRKRIKKELAMIASSIRAEPSAFVRSLHKLLHAPGHMPTEKTIVSDNGDMVPCWCITVDQPGPFAASQANIYVSISEPIRIAVSLDKNFTPVSMYQCSKNAKAVLAEFGL